jgi:UDP:flavonoid glycosyltransferase YjiC (YdhE family)
VIGAATRAGMTRLRSKVLLRAPDVHAQDIFDVLKGPSSVLKIVSPSRHFPLRSGDFDDTFLFVGPSISERKHAATFPREKLRGRIIYPSLGTTANADFSFYRQCFEVFAERDATVVMSVGKRIDMTQMRSIPLSPGESATSEREFSSAKK